MNNNEKTINDKSNCAIKTEYTDLSSNNALLPCTLIHEIPEFFYEPNKSYLIANIPISAKIIDVILDSHYFNSYSYIIEIIHGDFKWQIRRRYRHFLFLHQQLRIAFFNKSTWEFLDRSKASINLEKKNLPKFPHKLEALVSEDELDVLKDRLETYLNIILEKCREHHACLNFLEISRLSFFKCLGHKGKEGYVSKKSGGHQSANLCIRFRYAFSLLPSNWNKRWLIIKDSFLIYLHPKSGRIRFVLLMDREFKATFVQKNDKTLRISNLSRHLTIRCETKRKAHEWFDTINRVAQTYGSEFTRHHRYDSFAPIRQYIPCQWYVDGKNYFEAIADALEEAKEEIFLACWWFSPEIYMKRPMIHGDKWRIDKILQRKAEKGVKIFVLLYKEIEFALGINSLYSKQQLMRLHPNIKVLRHPNIAPIFWSHHEKLVIIDQNMAFVGGMDLCYGRWDTFEHKLTDLAGLKFSKVAKQDVLDFDTGISELNENEQECKSLNDLDRISEISNEEVNHENCNTVKENKKSSKFRNKLAFFRAVSRMTRLVPRRNPSLESLDDIDSSKLSSLKKTPSEIEISKIEGGTKFWVGKDYCNFILKDFSRLDQPYQELVDRRTTPRMPWHDVGLMVKGNTAKDIARHFIDLWNFVKFEKAQFIDKYPWLLPKSCSDFVENFKSVNCNYNAECQVVRSVADWSSGSRIAESSILESYIDIIDRAKHFIYIENQFFVTSSTRHKSREGIVINQVGEALLRRIIRAHRNNENFRVYVLITLLPAFEGEIGTSSGFALQAVTHWNMVSISRGSESLLSKLEREVGDPHKYINFYGLRNYGELNETLVNELIYIHSKLMIVDDLITLIGSANINDRSLTGLRDSEVAVVIYDTETLDGIMDGKPYKYGKFSGSLRRYLFKEHLGLIKAPASTLINISDPVSEDFYIKTWHRLAVSNTNIYEKVFGVYPSNEVKTFNQLRERQKMPWLADTDVTAARNELSKLQGHLVIFPLLFLEDENLEPAPGTKESLIPSSIWT